MIKHRGAKTIYPLAVGEVEPILGNLHVEIQYIAYVQHKVIRKKISMRMNFWHRFGCSISFGRISAWSQVRIGLFPIIT
jgi:hypothetical protein